MAKRKITKWQTTTYKALHRKLKVGQNENFQYVLNRNGSFIDKCNYFIDSS
jgi:hypothetical protein